MKKKKTNFLLQKLMIVAENSRNMVQKEIFLSFYLLYHKNQKIENENIENLKKKKFHV